MFQLVTGWIGLLAGWFLTYHAWGVHPALALLPALPTIGFMVRLFIIAHDCAHGSFVRSKAGNRWIGRLCAFSALTPFAAWRHSHALHHAQVGNLDERGHGDIWTMTVREYRAAPLRRRLLYRAFRNPLVLFVVGPFLYFAAWLRVPPLSAGRSVERRSILWTNAAIAVAAVPVVMFTDWPRFLTILGLLMTVAAGIGTWLFYVQHQFEATHWEPGDAWDFETAALRGSSFYALPPVLQWFSGNIGFHHVHHYASRIPNYHLEKAHRETPLFHGSPTLNLRQSLGTIRLALWDESSRRLLTFRQAARQAG